MKTSEFLKELSAKDTAALQTELNALSSKSSSIAYAALAIATIDRC